MDICSTTAEAIGARSIGFYNMDGNEKSSYADVVVCCRADDLIPEESETVLLALKRLPEKEAYDRVFRLRRAFQVSPPIGTYKQIGKLTIYRPR